MLALIFQMAYLILFISMILMSFFVAYHIMRYSYTSISKIIMLSIFVPVVLVLLLLNISYFQNIPLVDLFSNMLP